MLKYIVCFLFLFSASLSQAQYDHEAVFEGQTEDVLKESVIDAFKPINILTYGQARDTLYSKVYNVNDSVVGIYTDHRVYLPPGEDPTTSVFMDGAVNGINGEHSYPQSKGAGSGNPRSDMHHLFPCRVGANSARGSMPFGDVIDSSTDTWYYKTQEKPNIPSSDIIDKFSEKGSGRWEPREEVKGNIARAIMYFYTMYQQEADSADPQFFGLMESKLCEWHDLDPVDKLEWERTKMIAKWQEGKANPFILDCTLAGRVFCGGVSAACTAVDVSEIELAESFNIKSNPVNDYLNVEWTCESCTDDIQYSIYDQSGRMLRSNTGTIYGNDNNLEISVTDLAPGMYFLNVRVSYENGIYLVPLKFIKTP